MKVSDVMVTRFQTISVSGAGALAKGADGAVHLVVTSPDGHPVSLVSPSQVDLGALPVVPLVAEDADLDKTILDLTPQLLDRKELAGAVVLRGFEILGVLPRAVIAEHALLLLNQRSRGLAGNPQLSRPIYACPRGDYEKPVSYYDPSDPPRCPHDGDLLVRKA